MCNVEREAGILWQRLARQRYPRWTWRRVFKQGAQFFLLKSSIVFIIEMKIVHGIGHVFHTDVLWLGFQSREDHIYKAVLSIREMKKLVQCLPLLPGTRAIYKIKGALFFSVGFRG